MEFSQRMSTLPASPTVALNAKAKQLSAEGTKIFNFSVGEPDFETPQPIVDTAIAALKAGRTKYGQAGGGIALRTAIAKKFERENQINHSPDHIVVGVGAKELLFHISLAILNDGDEVLIPAPYWVSYPAHVLAAGARPVIIPMSEFETNGLTPQVIEKYATPKTKAIIINSPNNPAGYVLNRDTLETLGVYLESKPWWVISDEIYEYLAFDKPHTSLAQTSADLREKLIVVHGMAKGYAMTGWRVGFALTPEKLTKILKVIQSQSSTCLPGFIEDAAETALHLGRDLMESQCLSLRKRRDLALEIVRSWQKISFIQPEGAFYLFLDLRQALASAEKVLDNSTLKFGDYLLSKHHVATVPGEAFGAPGFLRISYATSESDLREGLSRIEKALLEWQNG